MSFNGAYNFGFSRPLVAKYSYNEGTGVVSYSDILQIGEGANTSINPSYSNAKLPGDNKIVEEVNEFVNAAVTLGVTRIPLKAAEILFGHTIDEIDGIEHANVNDVSNFVGYGFTTKNSDGTYDACVLRKVKFVEGEDSYQTKGESITFKQPTLSGSALAPDDGGDWKIKKFGFASEDAAVDWVKSVMGLGNQVAPVQFSNPSGTYDTSVDVALTTATPGATIYYTTDGTKPTTASTAYSSELTISANTMIRAIAVKATMTDSIITTEEYTIQ
jgi:phi13 family phage major tail protein